MMLLVLYLHIDAFILFFFYCEWKLKPIKYEDDIWNTFITKYSLKRIFNISYYVIVNAIFACVNA